jgi:omega-amidase
MKDFINVSIIQTEPLNLQVSDNIKQIERLIDNNKYLKDADLITLPEYFASGLVFNLEEAFEIGEKAKNLLKYLAKEFNSYVVGGTLPEVVEDKIYNSSFIYNRQGEIIDVYRKIHLYSFDEFAENTIFNPGKEDKVIDTDFAKLGVAVCYDLRFSDLFMKLRDKGAEIIVIPATWDYPFYEQWGILTRCRAVENQAYILATNITGKNNISWFFGNSKLIDYRGNVIKSLNEEPGILHERINLRKLREYRNRYPYINDYKNN